MPGVPFTMRVGWGDLDVNGHMRSTAYSDMAATARVHYLIEQGFPPARFAKLGIGPVLFEEHLVFYRECSFGDRLEVTLRIADVSDDGRRVSVEHEVLSADTQTLSAELRVAGGWLSLSQRRLVAPPDELRVALLGART